MIKSTSALISRPATALEALLLVGVIVPLAGCDPPGKPTAWDRYVMPGTVLAFAPLFQQNCVGCHGRQGKFGPAPPLNDPLFQWIVPREVLVDVITHGRPGTPMPAFALEHGGTLSAEQIQALADGMQDEWSASKERTATPPPYLLSGAANAATADAVKRGAMLFSTACASCHGDQGEGGPSAGALNNPAFLALVSDQALRRVIITGRPDLDMPDYSDSTGRIGDFQPLTSAQIDDLVAYLGSWRRPLRLVPQPLH